MALMDVFVDELRDLYSAENQLVQALPKLAKGAKDAELKKLFEAHLEETKGHVLRLQHIFQILEKPATGSHCNGMQGLIEEGSDALEKDAEGPSFDLGLTGGAMRVEHYEIAGYSCVIAMANALAMEEVADILSQTLEEEEAALEKVTAASEPLMESAAEQPADEDSSPKSAKERYSAQKSREDERAAATSVAKHAA